MAYTCYMLLSACHRRTYIGATVDLQRRLRQHNGEICGGARATSRGRPWRLHAAVHGFTSWRQTLSFEWHWKHRAGSKRICRGLSAREQRLEQLLTSEAFGHASRSGECPSNRPDGIVAPEEV